jgi:hypothetical protein
MLVRLAQLLVAVAIVAASFNATLFALDRWSRSATADPEITSSISSTPSIMVASDTRSSETALTELPKSNGFEWYVVRGLNVSATGDRPMVPGQTTLRLIAISGKDAHSLVARYRGLSKNQVYRITAWVKPEAGANVEIFAIDEPDGSPVNRGLVTFDLAGKTTLSAVGGKSHGTELGPDNWQKVWVDMVTADGQFLVSVRPARGASDTFDGDGRVGIVLGGIQVTPQG